MGLGWTHDVDGVGGTHPVGVHTEYTWDHSPGCFIALQGQWQGNCHWNLRSDVGWHVGGDIDGSNAAVCKLGQSTVVVLSASASRPIKATTV